MLLAVFSKRVGISRLLLEKQLVSSKPLSAWTHSTWIPLRAYHFIKRLRKSVWEQVDCSGQAVRKRSLENSSIMEYWNKRSSGSVIQRQKLPSHPPGLVRQGRSFAGKVCVHTPVSSFSTEPQAVLAPFVRAYNLLDIQKFLYRSRHSKASLPFFSFRFLIALSLDTPLKYKLLTNFECA